MQYGTTAWTDVLTAVAEQIGTMTERVLSAPAWTDVLTAVAAWVALVLSLVGIVISWRAYRLAERQEERRRPALVPYLRDGYVQYDDGRAARLYGFLLTVSNPTDSDNSVATADLQVTYSTPSGVQMTVKVPADSSQGKRFNDAEALITPARIDAHQTISGWVYFRVQEAIFGEGAIDRYQVVLLDSHGGRAVVEPVIVREYADEIPQKR